MLFGTLQVQVTGECIPRDAAVVFAEQSVSAVGIQQTRGLAMATGDALQAFILGCKNANRCGRGAGRSAFSAHGLGAPVGFTTAGSALRVVQTVPPWKTEPKSGVAVRGGGTVPAVGGHLARLPLCAMQEGGAVVQRRLSTLFVGVALHGLAHSKETELSFVAGPGLAFHSAATSLGSLQALKFRFAFSAAPPAAIRPTQVLSAIRDASAVGNDVIELVGEEVCRDNGIRFHAVRAVDDVPTRDEGVGGDVHVVVATAVFEA